MKFFETPEMDVVKFAVEDVVTTSNPNTCELETNCDVDTPIG